MTKTLQKKKTNSFGTHMYHTRPSVSCSTAGHQTHGVWPHTPHSRLVFISKIQTNGWLVNSDRWSC